jgi:hypothetical protein
LTIQGEVEELLPPAPGMASDTAGRTDNWTLTAHLLDLSMQDLPEESHAAAGAPHETDPGAVVGLNENDNAGARGTTDSEEQSLPAPDTDLRILALTLAPVPNSGTVSLSVPEGVRLWTGRRKTVRIRSGQWQMPADRADLLDALGADPDAIEVDVKLAVEGLQPGEAGHLELSRTSAPGGPPAATDRIRVTVAEADLDVDTDYDGRIAEADDPAEATGYGFLLGVNDNDDDGDGHVDWNEEEIDGPADRAANVRALRIGPAPAAAGTGTFRLTTGGSDHVRIFDEVDAPVIGPRAGTTVEIPAGDVPEEGLTYRIEALAAGKEVEVELTLQREDGTSLHADRVKVSTLGAAVAGGYYADASPVGPSPPVQGNGAPPTLNSVSAMFSLRNSADGSQVAAAGVANNAGSVSVRVPTARAVNVEDPGGRPSHRWFVPVSAIGERHPCVPLLNLDGAISGGAADAMTRGQAGIFDAEGNAGHVFKVGIKGSESFQRFVGLAEDAWVAVNTFFRWLGLDAGERQQIIGPRPDERNIYEAVRAAFGVDADNEKYFWTTPLIHEPGEHRFTIRRDMHSEPVYALKLTVFNADMDIDSDNVNGLERSAREDGLEDVPDEPGMIVQIDGRDLDADKVPEHVDGFDRFGDDVDPQGEDDTASPLFSPLKLELSQGITAGDARIRFRYSGSDPCGVEVDNDDVQPVAPGTGELDADEVVVRSGRNGTLDTAVHKKDVISADGKSILAGDNGRADTAVPDLSERGYRVAPGKLRLWLRDGEQTRNPQTVADGGDYLDPYDSAAGTGVYGISEVGLSPGATATFYLEGIRSGRERIVAEVDPDGPGAPVGFIAADAVRVNVLSVDRTEWLVTHDPELEKRCWENDKYKQAELMGNRAVFTVRCGADEAHRYSVKLHEPGGLIGGPGDLICDAHYLGHTSGAALFAFRTTDGSATGGARTDEQGRIYINDPVENPPEDHPLMPGKYPVCVYRDGHRVAKYKLRIGPLMHRLEFSPNIIGDNPATLDPYSDPVLLEYYGPMGTELHEPGWGLEMNYQMKDQADDLTFEFRDASSAQGDMGGMHALAIDEWDMKKLPKTHEIKWEGFDASISEDGDHIYKWAQQVQLSPENTVAEGHYLLDIGMKRKEDTTQEQKIQVQFEVDYGLEFE